MAYRFFEGNQFRKGVRSIKLQEHIKEIQLEVNDIIQHPLKETEPLVGNLAIPGLRYRKIRSTNPEYRILFIVYECGFELVANKPYCSHDKCEVGVEDNEVEPAQEDMEELDIFPTQDIAATPCEGLIKFALFGPRHLFTNLYKLRKKEMEKLLK